MAERLDSLADRVVFLGGIADGRPIIEKEIESAAPEVRDVLAREVARLLTNEAFAESRPGQLRGDSASQAETFLCDPKVTAVVSAP